MKKTLSYLSLAIAALFGVALAQPVITPPVFVPPSPSTTYSIPSDYTYPWQPGVTYNGGIPLRTSIYTTLAPSGDTTGATDANAINTAFANCPGTTGGGNVVKLAAGTYYTNASNPISLRNGGCTLRGAGPGTRQTPQPYGNVYIASPASCGAWAGFSSTCTVPFVPTGTGTFIIRADYKSNDSQGVMYIGGDPTIPYPWNGSIALTADAARLATSITVASTAGLSVGQVVYLDQVTDSNPDVYFDSNQPSNNGSRCWFQNSHCKCTYAQTTTPPLCARTIAQVIKIRSIAGNVLTLYDPLSYAFTMAANAEISLMNGVNNNHQAPVGIGVEELAVFGGNAGDGNGDMSMSFCDSCWIRHVDAAWSNGTVIGLYSTYKSEVRDSFMHESAYPYPGGGGYLSGINTGAFGNLFENNIMWAGDKVNVMRNTGGGNVYGYNYTDDAFGANFPDSPEAGINAGHYTTPHYELIEGNYSHNFKSDTFWGNSIYITVFRNHLSGLRAAYGSLPSYTYNSGSCLEHYVDGGGGRRAVDVQGSPGVPSRQVFVGNVLGMQGQAFTVYNMGCDNINQTSWIYENITTFLPSGAGAMFAIGNWQDGATGNWNWDATTFQTDLRQGNWDWYTQSAHWYTNPIGASGASTGTPMGLPSSLYAPSMPPFFGSNTWPWVDPSNGAVHTLPAKARFDAGTPNACSNYDATNGVCLD